MMQNFPHKLRLGKKSGRYDLSQDIYVLTVFVGETPFVQCTLTTPSLASQCIEYISHKMSLGQIEMFGLRYQMKSNDPNVRVMRWVQLDRPLKKQLEKWACKPWERKVQLAVLYHTPNVFILTDPVARSYYMHMMKLDIVEGRVTVNVDKYITLAAYSLQVEYGDYDERCMSIEAIQDLPLLPKQICRSAQLLEELLKKVLSVYQSMKGKRPRDAAALLYIVDVIQSEGYGEEYFKAKDEDSTEVKVGYAPEGIIVHHSFGVPIKFVWNDIREITSSKRHLQLKLVDDDALVQYTMESAEWARYVAMVFNWQSVYAMNKAKEDNDAPIDMANLQGGIKTPVPHMASTTELNTNRVTHSDHFLHSSAMDMAMDSHRLGAERAKSPLSSVSFRHPVNTVQIDERARAASTVIYTTTSQPSSSYSPWPHSGASMIPGSSTSGSPSLTPLTRSEIDVGARAASEMPRKMMGSSPEMRVLGVSREAPSSAPSISHGPSVSHLTSSSNVTMEKEQMPQSMVYAEGFQSTPNLVRQPSRRKGTLEAVADCYYQMSPPHVDSLKVTRALSDRQFNRVVRSPDIVPRLPPVAPSTSSSSNAVYRSAMTVASEPSFSSKRPAPPVPSGEVSHEELMADKIRATLALPMDVLRADFSRIPNKRMSAGTSTSLKPENHGSSDVHPCEYFCVECQEECRNRTRSIVPYEDNRVTLRSHKSNPTGYVNASNIEMSVGHRKMHFILAQAPLKETVDDFWAAVWEGRVHVVVMLSEARLDNGANAPIYWPLNPSAKVETREVVVKHKAVAQSQSEVTTTLELKHRHSGERRQVYHMRFVGWPIEKCPNSEGELLAFMDSVRSVHRHVENERARRSESTIFGSGRSNGSKRSRSTSRKNLSDVSNQLRSKSVDPWRKRLGTGSSNGSGAPSLHSTSSSVDSSSTDSGAPPSPGGETPSPLLVHCHTGSYESGVYLLAELGLRYIEMNQPFDMADLLGRLRAQRMSLVKTAEQYRFAHSLVAASLRQSRLI